MNQQDLNKYFSTVWHSRVDQYRYSGWELINKIHPDENVIDVGCGHNLFKGKISNIVGIDPAFLESDYQTTIEEFQIDQKFDVAFCLGSINFGSEENILIQIQCVVKLLKSSARIYWRCNPGRADHGNEACKEIDFYPWSFAKHVEFAERFGFRLTMVCYDTNERIYAEWHR
jgi:hypothetical protein